MKQGIKDRLISAQKSLKTTQTKLDKKPVKLNKSKRNRKGNKSTELLSKRKQKKNANRKPEKLVPKRGEIHFKSECNSIPLKQFGITYKLNFIHSSLKLQNIPFNIKLNGLDQIPNECDICNATFIRKGNDFYLNVMIYKTNQKNSRFQQTEVPVGIDFGITTPMTLSDGLKLSWNLPVTTSIKHITRKCFKKPNKKIKNEPRVKGTKRVRNKNGRVDSNNRKKDFIRRAKKYERLSNQRTDTRNKIVSFMKNRYAVIVMQDDSIKGWQSGGMGRSISNTGIGGIKTALKNKAATSILVDQFYPSTKTCSHCGNIKDMRRDEKEYICPECSIIECRDVNGARNTLEEGLRLNPKTMIQKNLENYNHIKREDDMVRESERIKTMEETKEWIELMQLRVLDEQKLSLSWKECDKMSTYGAYESCISPFVRVNRNEWGRCEVKPEEKLTAGSSVVRMKKY